MPTARISKQLNDGIYFLTPTIWNWYYIFDRHERWEILADSLIFCQKNKGLEIHQYVFMLNHLHLIVSSKDVAGFLRDFKRHTTKLLFDNINKHEPNLVSLFLDDNDRPRFWKADNQPKKIESREFYRQKANYIHLNPVKKGYVERPEYWKWSSANPATAIQLDELI